MPISVVVESYILHASHKSIEHKLYQGEAAHKANALHKEVHHSEVLTFNRQNKKKIKTRIIKHTIKPIFLCSSYYVDPKY